MGGKPRSPRRKRVAKTSVPPKARRPSTRKRKAAAPRLSVDVYYKVGRGKRARWKVRKHATDERPAFVRWLKPGQKPYGDYYRLVRSGPAKGRAILVSGQTGHPIPRGELPAKEDHQRTIVAFIRKHLKEATGQTWTARYKLPRWRGWHSEYEITPKTGDKNPSSWLQILEAFQAMAVDPILEKLIEDSGERLHFGADHYTPEKLLPGRWNRDYMAMGYTGGADVFAGVAFNVNEWAKRYKDALIFGLTLSMRKAWHREG
jgi:hypothetical protein